MLAGHTLTVVNVYSPDCCVKDRDISIAKICGFIEQYCIY